MLSLLYRFAAWLARKLAVLLLIGGLALAAYATWLFLHEEADYEAHRARDLKETTAQRDRAASAYSELNAEVELLQGEIRQRQERLGREQKVLAALKELQSRWQRWFGNAEQQRLNDAKRQRVQELQAEDRKRLLELQRSFTQKAWERQGTGEELARLNKEISQLEGGHSALLHYFAVAWRTLRAPLGLLVILDLFGAYLWRLMMYVAVAPFVVRGRPLRFSREMPTLPQESESRATFDVAVWPGERLRLKRKYLRSTDGRVDQGSRFLLDWWKPLSSLLCGFVRMAELRNRHAHGESEVGIAGREGDEIAMLHVPEGSSLVVKPRFLVGVIQPADQRLVIRMRWPIWSRQAWVTGQIRFLEFQGPCRLIVAGARGVRTERVVASDEGSGELRRAERATLIGFTPNLEVRLVRTRAFKAYLQGRKKLFEVLFAGTGLYAVAAGPYERGTGPFSRAFFRVRNGILDILGL